MFNERKALYKDNIAQHRPYKRVPFTVIGLKDRKDFQKWQEKSAERSLKKQAALRESAIELFNLPYLPAPKPIETFMPKKFWFVKVYDFVMNFFLNTKYNQ